MSQIYGQKHDNARERGIKTRTKRPKQTLQSKRTDVQKYADGLLILQHGPFAFNLSVKCFGTFCFAAWGGYVLDTNGGEERNLD